MKKQYIDSLNSPRFSGIKTFMRLPYSVELTDVDFAIIGVPFDTGSTFATGSRFVHKQSASICYFKTLSSSIKNKHSGLLLWY